MNNATQVFTSTIGAIMALAGIEHGVGEMLQGNVVSSGVVIQSWPASAFFRSVGGEPAMTVIPNLQISGVLTLLVSFTLLVWVIGFIQKKNGSRIMILLSIGLLLVGGGFFPPVLSILIALAGTKIRSPLNWWKVHLSVDLRQFLARCWPWFYAADILLWLAMLPGLSILGFYFGVESTALILAILSGAFGFFLLTFLSGLALDSLKMEK